MRNMKLNHYYRFTSKDEDNFYDVIAEVIGITDTSLGKHAYLKDKHIIESHYLHLENYETEWADYVDAIFEAFNITYIGDEFNKETHPEYFL